MILALQNVQRASPSAGIGIAATTLVAVVLGTLAIILIILALDRRQRRRPPRSTDDEWYSRAQMGELCPHGWTARLHVYSWNAERPEDAPADERATICIDWRELPEFADAPPPAARRIWATSVGAALRAMVDDRRLDLALEEIERSVGEVDD
jgi:hypothetical protein